MQSHTNPQTPIVIYQSADGSIATEVLLEGDMVESETTKDFLEVQLEGAQFRSSACQFMEF